MIPGSGGTQRLSRLIGLSRAKFHIMTATRIQAQQALDWGILVRAPRRPRRPLRGRRRARREDGELLADRAAHRQGGAGQGHRRPALHRHRPGAQGLRACCAPRTTSPRASPRSPRSASRSSRDDEACSLRLRPPREPRRRARGAVVGRREGPRRRAVAGAGPGHAPGPPGDARRHRSGRGPRRPRASPAGRCASGPPCASAPWSAAPWPARSR